MAIFAETTIGIVLAQEQTILTTARQHAIRLVRALDHEIVNEHADVRFVAPQHQRLAPAQRQTRVDASDEPLRRRFFIARGAVDLSCAIKSAHALRLQAWTQLLGIDQIVLNGVRRAHDLARFQAWQRVDHLQLHIHRQAGRKSLHIELRRAQSFRLDEQLMAALVGKTHHLVFDRRAIAWTCAFNEARVEGRTVEIGADDGVGLCVGVGEMAAHLFQAVVVIVVVPEGEMLLVGVGWLHLHLGKIDAAHVHARRCASFETHHVKSGRAQAF